LVYKIGFQDAKLPIVYYSCAKIYPENFPSLPNSFQGLIELAGLIFFVIVKIKIRYFKKTGNIDWNAQSADFRKNFTLESVYKSSLTSFKTNFGILLIYSTFIFVTVKLNRSQLSDIGQYPNYMYYYIFQLVSPVLIASSVAALIYARNSAMAGVLYNEMKSYVELRM
jgi:hypothetical protein